MIYFNKTFMQFILTGFLFCALFTGCSGDTDDTKKTDPEAAKAAEIAEKKEVVDEETLKLLMKYGVHQAALEGDLEAIQGFIKAGAPLEEYDKHKGLTPLLYAARQGHLDVVRALVKAGVDINKPGEVNGYTALHMAAYNDHLEIVKFLVEQKANPNLQTDLFEETPLHLAAEEGYAEVVTALLAAPTIDLTITEWNGKTAKEVAKDDSIKALFP